MAAARPPVRVAVAEPAEPRRASGVQEPRLRVRAEASEEGEPQVPSAEVAPQQVQAGAAEEEPGSPQEAFQVPTASEEALAEAATGSPPEQEWAEAASLKACPGGYFLGTRSAEAARAEAVLLLLGPDGSESEASPFWRMALRPKSQEPPPEEVRAEAAEGLRLSWEPLPATWPAFETSHPGPALSPSSVAAAVVPSSSSSRPDRPPASSSASDLGSDHRTGCC